MNSQDLKEKIDQVFTKYLENPRENHELVPLIFILTQKSEEMELAKIKAKTSLEKTQIVMKQLTTSGALKAISDQLVPFLINRFNDKSIGTTKLKTEQEEIDQKIKSTPLKTIVNILGSTFQSRQNSDLKKKLGTLWDEFEKLFNSNSETEARENLRKLRNLIDISYNPVNLLQILDSLEQHQKDLINKIMTFDLGES